MARRQGLRSWGGWPAAGAAVAGRGRAEGHCPLQLGDVQGHGSGLGDGERARGRWVRAAAEWGCRARRRVFVKARHFNGPPRLRPPRDHWPARRQCEWDNLRHEQHHHQRTPRALPACARPAAWPPKCWTTSHRISSPASPRSRSTAWAPMHGAAGHQVRHRGLPAARLPALPRPFVHLGQPCGVPRHSQRQALKKGDIVNVDVTVITPDGWYGDNSRMYLIGECSIAAKRLSALTFDAMWLGIQQVRPGARLGDIGHAIRNTPRAMACRWCASSAATALARSSTKTRRCCTTAARHGPELAPGMTFTIEPMLNLGKRDIRSWATTAGPSSPGPQPLGPVGAHGAGHGNRLRRAHAVSGLARPALVRDGHRHLMARGWRQRPSRQTFMPSRLSPDTAPLQALQALRDGYRQDKAALLDKLQAARALHARHSPAAAAVAPDRPLVAGCGRARAAAGLGAGGGGRLWRAQLFPHSDVDVLLLLPDGTAAALDDARKPIEAFISSCWDAGLEIGSSVRSVAECLSESAADVTVQTALLEARAVAATRHCSTNFAGATTPRWTRAPFCRPRRWRCASATPSTRTRPTRWSPTARIARRPARPAAHHLGGKRRGLGSSWASWRQRPGHALRAAAD